MGLQADVEFTPPPRANVIQRVLHTFGATRPGAFVFSKTLAPMDRVSYRLSGGRFTVAGKIGGFPLVMLTTTGARSGLERTSPLTAIPVGDDLALIASNYGIGRVPGWAHNLRANPDATILYGNHSVPVQAREASGDETEVIFASAARIYPGYRNYRERSVNPIPVFVLEAAGSPS